MVFLPAGLEGIASVLPNGGLTEIHGNCNLLQPISPSATLQTIQLTTCLLPPAPPPNLSPSFLIELRYRGIREFFARPTASRSKLVVLSVALVPQNREVEREVNEVIHADNPFRGTLLEWAEILIPTFFLLPLSPLTLPTLITVTDAIIIIWEPSCPPKSTRVLATASSQIAALPSGGTGGLIYHWAAVGKNWALCDLSSCSVLCGQQTVVSIRDIGDRQQLQETGVVDCIKPTRWPSQNPVHVLRFSIDPSMPSRSIHERPISSSRRLLQWWTVRYIPYVHVPFFQEYIPEEAPGSNRNRYQLRFGFGTPSLKNFSASNLIEHRQMTSKFNVPLGLLGFTPSLDGMRLDTGRASGLQATRVSCAVKVELYFSSRTSTLRKFTSMNLPAYGNGNQDISRGKGSSDSSGRGRPPGDIRNTASGKLWACGDLEDDLEEEETGFGSAFGLETLQDALQDEIHQSWHGSLSPHDVTAFFDTSRGLASGVGVDTPSEILRSLWAKIIHYQSMVLNIYLPSLSLGLSFKGATGRSESGDGVGPIGMVKTRTEVEDKGEKDENLVEGLKYNKMEMTLDAVRKLLVLFDDILY
ncbi:hypothetical protein J3R30DRAFT_3400237 [Lentinula aciculospora]|uniref:Uncharacterized protein n=1 Tax=Lentinula aciculospora TaxID=153920 RepID=A0A9W9DYD4_9AGAR|nr:hypothetical protein J3R30DRAFT_3400237 [Lentinula aciculospora]